MNFPRVPWINLAALSTLAASHCLSEGEGSTKDPCDRRVEGALKRDFEASSLALRALEANYIMAHTLPWLGLRS